MTNKNKNPMDMFMNLGSKVTKGDPVRKMDFDYYFMWIIFIAFSTILISRGYDFFFVTQDFSSLGWALVMVGILWFQYHNLSNFYNMRKIMKQKAGEPEPELKIESVDEMMEGFEKPKVSSAEKTGGEENDSKVNNK